MERSSCHESRRASTLSPKSIHPVYMRSRYANPNYIYPKINSDSNIVNGFSDKDAFTQCRNIAYIKSKNPGTTQYYFSTTL